MRTSKEQETATRHTHMFAASTLVMVKSIIREPQLETLPYLKMGANARSSLGYGGPMG